MAKYDYIEFLGGGAFGRVEKVRRKWDQKVKMDVLYRTVLDHDINTWNG